MESISRKHRKDFVTGSEFWKEHLQKRKQEQNLTNGLH